MRDVLRFGVGVLAVLLAGGCGGPGITFGSLRPTLDYSGADLPLVVGVQDRREYVVSGRTPAHYVGQRRGAFGMPRHEYTETMRALSVDVGQSLARTFVENGYRASQVMLSPQSDLKTVLRQLMQVPAEAYLLVTLHEFMYDRFGGLNHKLSYKLGAQVFDGQGNLVGSAEVADERQIDRYAAFDLEEAFSLLFKDARLAQLLGRAPPLPPPAEE